MTDIYDLRDPMFTTYKDEWNIIFKAVRQYIAATGKSNTPEKWLALFQKHIPDMCVKCPENILKELIKRASYINYHELVTLPNKSPS